MAKEKDIRHIYQLLADENLEAFYPAFRGQLKIEKVDQLAQVTRHDLSSIGIVSGPDIKHFQRVLEKATKHGGMRGTLKNRIFKGKVRDQKKDTSLLMKMELLIRQEAVIIQSSSVQIEKEIGKGQFGTVHQGQWARYYGDESVKITIAIKSITSGHGHFGMGEAQVLSEFGQDHPNIIKFYGLIIGDSSCIKLVTEFAEYGSLMDQLTSGKIRQIATLCQFAVQIASGMAYLEKRNLVHRDLAARNILVTASNQVKISDFGLSKSLGERTEFVMENQEMLPLRWLAPECLNEGVFTTASDVWSFGIVLWEMFTLGKYPWEMETGEEVRDHITKGDMLPEPDYCPQRIYPYIMCRCWSQNASDRPRFDELHERLIIHQPVVVSAMENSTEPSPQHLVYLNDHCITCLKNIGLNVLLQRNEEDLWLGQSQETQSFGRFKKSTTRPLAPTILSLHSRLPAIDLKMIPQTNNSNNNKYVSYLPGSSEDKQPESNGDKVDAFTPFWSATEETTEYEPVRSLTPPPGTSSHEECGIYVNMNSLPSPDNEFPENEDTLYANIGIKVVNGVCERYIKEEEGVEKVKTDDEDPPSTTVKSIKASKPLVPPRPKQKPIVPPKPLSLQKEITNLSAVGDNTRDDGIECPNTDVEGRMTYFEVEAGGDDIVMAITNDLPTRTPSVGKLHTELNDDLLLTKSPKVKPPMKSVSASQLSEEGDVYSNMWDSLSVQQKSSNHRHSSGEHSLAQTDFSQSFPGNGKGTKPVSRSLSTSSKLDRYAGKGESRKKSTGMARSPESLRERKRHLTFSWTRGKSTDTLKSPQEERSKLDSNVLLDYIRRMKLEIPEASDVECVAALEANQDIVDFAIKHIKVNRIMEGGLFKREEDACQLLVNCCWELAPAIRESKLQFLRQNFSSISILECTETLENFNWNVHEVSESFMCRRYLEACSSIGVSQDVALLTLEKHNRDEIEAIRYLKASSVQEVTGRPYLRCREILSNCKWDIAKSIDYLLDFNRKSQP